MLAFGLKEINVNTSDLFNYNRMTSGMYAAIARCCAHVATHVELFSQVHSYYVSVVQPTAGGGSDAFIRVRQ